MKLFEKWKDDNLGRNLAVVLALIMLGLTIFLTVNIEMDKTVFYYVGITAVFVIVVAKLGKTGLLQGNFFGSKQRLYAGVFAGAILGGILGHIASSSGANIVLPTQALYIGDLTFILANIVAPVLEPLFWRGIVFPTAVVLAVGIIGQRFKWLGIFFALLLSAYLFGFYHVNVFSIQAGGSPEATFNSISFATLFAVFFTLGNSIMKTLGLEVGWHFVNNLFAQGMPLAQVILTVIFFGLIFVVLVEVVSRWKK